MPKQKLYVLNGMKKTLREWAEEYDIPHRLLRGRINRGFSLRKSLFGVNKYNLNPDQKRHKVWSGKRLEQLLKMQKDRATLKQMGEKFGVCRERIRQVLEYESLKALSTETPKQYLSKLACSTVLDISPPTLPRLLRSEDGIKYNGNRTFIPVSLIPTLRERLAQDRTVTCATCGNEFQRNERGRNTKYCDKDCRPNHNEYQSTEVCTLWHQETQDLLQHHEPQNDWITLKPAADNSELSVMQIVWLGKKKVLSMLPHPTKMWRGRPVIQYSLSEVRIAGRVYKKFRQSGKQKLKV